MKLSTIALKSFTQCMCRLEKRWWEVIVVKAECIVHGALDKLQRTKEED